MKNFLGSWFLILIFGCNPCNSLLTNNDFDKNIAYLDRIKDVINENGLLNKNNKKIDQSFLRKKISNEDFELLKRLKLKNIKSSFNNTMIFDFGNQNEIENSSCNYYLFYHPDANERHKIANFEQFTECRYEFIDLNNNWTLVNRKIPCRN